MCLKERFRGYYPVVIDVETAGFNPKTDALLEPTQALRDAEDNWDFSSRLALMEETKSLPWQAVWDYVCAMNGVAVGADWLSSVKNYEKEVLSARK